MAEKRELLTLKQVAEWLQVSDRTVHRLMDDGQLHGMKVGRQWRFEEKEVEAYINSLAQTSREVDRRMAREHEREMVAGRKVTNAR